MDPTSNSAIRQGGQGDAYTHCENKIVSKFQIDGIDEVLRLSLLLSLRDRITGNFYYLLYILIFFKVFYNDILLL